MPVTFSKPKTLFGDGTQPGLLIGINKSNQRVTRIIKHKLNTPNFRVVSIRSLSSDTSLFVIYRDSQVISLLMTAGFQSTI